MDDRVRSVDGGVVVPGEVSGNALVTRQGFSSLASFYGSLVSGASTAICSDQDNPDLFGRALTGKILCLPYTTGSTSAGATWDRVASLGIAPLAMLFSEPVDSLAVAGLLLAEIWAGAPIVAIDRLGEEFLDFVEDDSRVEVGPGGRVLVCK